MVKLKVRIVPAVLENGKTGFAAAGRLEVSIETFFKLTNAARGEFLCSIERTGAPASSASSPAPLRRQACLVGKNQVRGSGDKIGHGVVFLSRPFYDASGFSLHDEVEITVLGKLPLAKDVKIREETKKDAGGEAKGEAKGGASGDAKAEDGDKARAADLEEKGGVADGIEQGDVAHWESALKDYLDRAVDVFPGMLLDGVCHGRRRRAFRVTAVDGSPSSLARYSRTSSHIRLACRQDAASSSAAPAAPSSLLLGPVPGFGRPVAALNEFLVAFTRPRSIPRPRSSVAAVVHGAHGTGKTHLLEKVAAAGWGTVFRVKPSDKSSVVRDTFELASAQRPSVVLLDGLHAIVRKDRLGYDAVVEVLAEELDKLAAEIGDGRASKAADPDNDGDNNNNDDNDGSNDGAPHLPQVVVLASCLDYFEDIPHELSKRGRFDRSILLSVPSPEERLEILGALDLPLPSHVRDEQLTDLAQHTHAYNPADLRRLVDKANDIAEARLDKADPVPAVSLSLETLSLTSSPPPPPAPPAPPAPPLPHLTRADLDTALLTIRPSTMAGINLKPPVVRWHDIGGQDDVKRALQRMVRITTTTASHPSRRKLIISPPRGMLLYGPPGCSKTLSAQAFATESGFNFFSVKGAELLNMYVGESERAMRTLFARAAAASPSIIFFDEIDSIAGQRGTGKDGSGGGGGGGRPMSAVNLITTLLTEMDGFETLSGVLVLAATNRPEAVDPALLRPGRFDQVVYVGPPDEQTREAIFRVHLRACPVSPDLDYADLARQTRGHSGASIKHMCAEAGQAALDRIMETEDRQGDGAVAVEERIEIEDMQQAIQRTPKLITDEMVTGYERWQKQFRPFG